MAQPMEPYFAQGYQRPDLAAAVRNAIAYAQQIKATSPEQALAVVSAWNDERRAIDHAYNVAMVSYHQNTQSAAAKAEQDFWDGARPTLRRLDSLYAKALTQGPHTNKISQRFGKQLIELSRCHATTFDPQIADDIAQEAKLVSQWTELASQSTIEFRGQRYNAEGIAAFFASPDRTTRLDAQRARESFMAGLAEQVGSIYHELVTLRHRMARSLGYPNYTPLGYTLMQRTRYGADEIALFRRTVREALAPLVKARRKAQARRINVSKILFHDEAIWDIDGNPAPSSDPKAILNSAQIMYDELGRDFGDFFRLLRKHDLLDVELRDGKAPGGFCTQFAMLGLPIVFANFNGTDRDILVVTHECGHAFQSYSSRHLPVVEYAFPTYEAAEIHSMGMELLTYPWMHLFFGDDADRYKRVHLEQIIASIPYLLAIDDFQHRVYSEPELSASQRNAVWREVEAEYLPDRDYGGHFNFFDSGGLWQRQGHLFHTPFYYVDYALAQICALQIHQRATTDRKQVLRDYVAMCKVGGSLPFDEILTVGGLRSPFDPTCIREVIAHVVTTIEALDE